MKPTRIAIIGTGGMANGHAKSFNSLPGCRVVVAVDIDKKRAAAFAEKHGIPEVYGSAEEALRSSVFDAVVIATTDPFHAPLSISCLKAGKHVLCEKPLALNHADAKRMVMAAKKAGTINMVNFSYRNWPAIHAITTLIESGKIGDIRHVEASYHQAWLVSNEWGVWQDTPALLWRLSKKHGSKGVLGDIGVHILDFATFPAGPIKKIYCTLKTFDKAPGNRIGDYKFDANDSALITVEFANGALGSIQTTRWMTGHINRLFLKISGTKGSIMIDSDHGTSEYKICSGNDIHTGTWKEKKAKAVPSLQKRFLKGIRTGVQDQPDFARGAEIQKLLDASFTSDERKAPVQIRG
jgi:predicted dehydrogenase